ncbi:unnamed protein product, partial [Staurois parvus]
NIYTYIHTHTYYIAKSIGPALQIIGFRCSNPLHVHRYIKSSPRHVDCFYKHL